MQRVSAFVDGFNFYHAIDDSGRNDLKWVNLRALCRQFAPSPQFQLNDLFYFSAYATWRPDAFARHREYVAALESVNVSPVLGKFKAKYRSCNSCQAQWTAHEEKETDVNLALYLLREAYRGSYDRAIVITGDSDIGPAVRMIKAEFPTIDFRVITPVGRGHSWELVNAAGGTAHAKKMKISHLEQALFPELVKDASGAVIATRPAKYAPASTP